MDHIEDLAQCSACGRIFADVLSFDEHRIGDYDQPGSRRCLTGEDQAKDFVCTAGIWRLERRSPAVIMAIAS